MAKGDRLRKHGQLVAIRCWLPGDSGGDFMEAYDKASSRRIRVEIRRVLLDTWDQIGVRDEPNAQDEYDGYIGEISDLIVKGAPDSAIVDYLMWAVNEHMGLSATREHMLPTIVELRKIDLSPFVSDQSV